jgi:hypothetical protein
MSQSDEKLELALLKLIAEPDSPVPVTVLPPPPANAPESTAAAIARCRQAWQQAFAEYVKKNRRNDGHLVQDKAARHAANAYRGAMPPLAGYEGVRDFIACVAYGMLIDAIPADRSGQLLYAAQVALSALPRAAARQLEAKQLNGRAEAERPGTSLPTPTPLLQPNAATRNLASNGT